MRAVFGQTSQQFSGGLVRADFHGGLRQNRAGIHARTIRNTVAPVTFSPAQMERCTGAAPRHWGSREKCRLYQPSAARRARPVSGSCRTPPQRRPVAGGRKLGHERFLARIGFDDRQTEFERGLLDWIRHQFATSSGWRVRLVSTATTSKCSVSWANSFNDGTATSGVPANSTST